MSVPAAVRIDGAGKEIINAGAIESDSDARAGRNRLQEKERRLKTVAGKFDAGKEFSPATLGIEIPRRLSVEIPGGERRIECQRHRKTNDDFAGERDAAFASKGRGLANAGQRKRFRGVAPDDDVDERGRVIFIRESVAGEVRERSQILREWIGFPNVLAQAGEVENVDDSIVIQVAKLGWRAKRGRSDEAKDKEPARRAAKPLYAWGKHETGDGLTAAIIVRELLEVQTFYCKSP